MAGYGSCGSALMRISLDAKNNDQLRHRQSHNDYTSRESKPPKRSSEKLSHNKCSSLSHKQTHCGFLRHHNTNPNRQTTQSSVSQHNNNSLIRKHLFHHDVNQHASQNSKKYYHPLHSLQNAKNVIIAITLAIVIGLVMDQSGMRFPSTVASPVEDMYRQWLHKDDHTLRAAKPQDFFKEKNLTSGVIDIEIFVDHLTLEVKVEGKRVMYKYNATQRSSPTSFDTVHRGVGVVVLHPATGDVMATAHYKTNEARAIRGLLDMLNNLQAGRILILAAPGDWRAHINEDSMLLLDEYMGGWFMQNVCLGEMWAGVGLIDGPLWAESATPMGNFSMRFSTPLRLAVTVPRFPPVQRCEWYSLPEHADRAKFCETYEGYGDFCNCNTTNITSPARAPKMEMKEQIPIVIATSRHQIKVLKQLQQLWSQAGGGNTSILLSVDGLQREARDFAKVMGIQSVFHHNQASVGTLARISEHIKFSIYQVFRLNPEANKIIVLEDDLMVSPDFISYFHQTAPLLDADKSIFCINAYNYNSFLPTAIDTSRLYREDVLPAYGWMISRELSQELLPYWPPTYYIVDWDWYVRGIIQKGRAIVTPEVPRTYHDGHGGLHVTGWEQTAYFDRRPLNKDPDAKVNISYLTKDAYESFLERELQSATVIEITEHPCNKEYVPKEKVGSFLFYVYGETEKDDHISYYTLVTCLNGYERGRMEHHRLMYTIGYYGNALYIVACPGSYYCRIKEEDYPRLVYNATRDDLTTSIKYKQRYVREMTHLNLSIRTPAESFLEEATMLNYRIFEHKGIMSEVGEDGKLAM